MFSAEHTGFDTRPDHNLFISTFRLVLNQFTSFFYLVVPRKGLRLVETGRISRTRFAILPNVSVNQIRSQLPWDIPGKMGVGIMKWGGDTTIVRVVAAFRGATGSRPPGWGVRPPDCIPTAIHYLTCKLGICRGQFGYSPSAFPGINLSSWYQIYTKEHQYPFWRLGFTKTPSK